MDTCFIGVTPSHEDCAQIGVTPMKQALNRLECRAYIEALRRKYGGEPEGAFLKLKGQPHDFGMYYEVAVVFDGDNEEAAGYASRVDEGMDYWEDANMWAPVKYDGTDPIQILREPLLWLKEQNPLCHASLEAAGLLAVPPTP